MQRKMIAPAAGKILIAEPALNDFYFKQSVIMLADHNEDGSLGIIINKPMDIRLSKVIKGWGGFNPRLFFGGPVSTDSIFFIHRMGNRIPGAQKVTEGVFWGGDWNVVLELMLQNQITMHDIRIFMGYSGWSAHQLDSELTHDSWVVSTLTPHQLFYTRPSGMWSSLVRNLGSHYAIWANYPADPAMN